MIKKENSTNRNHVYYRMAASAAQFIILSTTANRVSNNLQAQIPHHPELKECHDLSLRYVTVWNIGLQLIYTCLVFACDLSVALKQEHMVPDVIRTFTNTLFYGLIFPGGISISIGFWLYYTYDRELIFPKSADLTMSFFDNFVSHGLVNIYALFELAFIPRDSKHNVTNPLLYQLYFEFFYLFVIFYTRYVDLGVWPYKILTVTEGNTLLFNFFVLKPIVISVIMYRTQWRIQAAIWKLMDKSLEKNN